ncbi:DUF1573 domain-containing protein [Plebeiibacterium sediminum]|uniref:DUF1573 domain-containing protein n=1 Tax=Plebeiibacterium sediminum TaxID=2992112 RepID=A0AAE3M6C0_9BACT|nr:DUF1573 domain-containing protein [Plebeiobacterium sediminum]MCW3788096.1 DUF1573 domain-containing protein [Plebeiobacterium sediminum]
MMNRFYQILFYLLVVLLVGCNQTNSDKTSVSKNYAITTAEFDKLIHNFGNITQGETVGCYYKVTNTGKTPLVIYNVKPGCGCTTAKYTKDPILPGKVGEIEIRFDSRGFSGNQYKVIRVDANIEKKSKELAITANVIN